MHRHPTAVHSSGYGSAAALKVCAKLKDLDGGLWLHCHVVESGLLETNPFVGCALVSMYAKCGSLIKAEQVFKKLPAQDVVSWTTLIAAYADQRQCKKALTSFERMQDAGILPNAVTFSSILRACDSIGKGREIHAEVERHGLLERDVVVGNSLVGMYAKLGSLGMAQEIFNKLPLPNIVAWTSLISGYVDNGESDEAIECFKKMQSEGIIPNAVTFVCCLKACSCTGAIDRGRDIHFELERRGLLEMDPIVGSALLDMYARCGLPRIAQEVFDKLRFRCIVMWNTHLSTYADYGDNEETLRCFEQIQMEGIFPDVVTFVISLTACRSLEIITKGKELHTKLEALGLLESDPAVGNALIDMYAKCGSLGVAWQTLDKLPVRDVVSWTTVMAGYGEYGHFEKALECLGQMKLEGVCPDAVTFACSLKACSSIGATDRGREIHTKIDEQSLLKRDSIVGNTLLNMYVKCGFLALAKQVFDDLPVRDDVSWNTMLSGYAEHGLGDEALKWLDRVRSECVSPSAAMFVLALKACSSIGAMNKGAELHAEIESLGLLGKDLVVGNTLLGMYVTNGLLSRAEEVFDELSARDVVSWTTLMAGYSQLGKRNSVFLTFERMLKDGVKPDSVAFVVVLTVCARSGSLNKSELFFVMMTRDYGIVPHTKHLGCIVNMFGRAGQLDSAVAIMKITPTCANTVMWHTFLEACRNWGCAYLGEKAFDTFVHLNKPIMNMNALIGS